MPGHCIGRRSESADTATLRGREEEWKQTSTARKVIGYAIRAHYAKQHAQAPAMGWRPDPVRSRKSLFQAEDM
jgi:hypothetical protein